MSQPLKQGVAGLELTGKATLAILALASGVYTYLGVRSLLDGTAAIVFFAAVIYSVAVSVGIYAFWSYLARLFPHVRDAKSRVALLGAMGLGSAMIVAMSSWLNAAALAGSAALEQHLAVTLQDYSRDLDQAHSNALAAQSLLPDIRLASGRFARLAEQEQASGSLTGTSGSGSVVQLLSQMSAQLDGLADSVETSRARVQTLFEEGGAKLSAMRELVTASGPVEPRSDAFAEQAVALTGVIAALQQTSVAPSVKRAAEDLARGFIAPAANGTVGDLASRQTAVMDSVREAVAAQSAALAGAADEILAQPKVETKRFVPLSTAEAVLRYARDFLPSWAGAISIDLLPAVMILIIAIVQGVIRREAEAQPDANAMTAAEILRAVVLYRMMEGAGRRPAAGAEPYLPPERGAAPAYSAAAEPSRVEPLPQASPLEAGFANAGGKVSPLPRAAGERG